MKPIMSYTRGNGRAECASFLPCLMASAIYGARPPGFCAIFTRGSIPQVIKIDLWCQFWRQERLISNVAHHRPTGAPLHIALRRLYDLSHIAPDPSFRG